MTSGITIDLQAGDAQRRAAYGILLESITVHPIVGRGVHNRGSLHRIQVWENRPSKVTGADPDQLVDPRGRPTSAPYSVTTSAQPVIIAAHPIERAPEGAALSIGDTVVLAVSGYRIGEYVVEAEYLRDPHLVPVTA